ncbi:MAG: ABC transporter permease [Acetobacteraceae bacterium]|nr:ABC transporter permease [Acetobacteraceae bacterium]
MPSAAPDPTSDAKSLVLPFADQLDVAAAARLWVETQQAAHAGRDRALVFDLAAVTGCDTSGATLLLEAERSHGGTTTIIGANDGVAAVIALVRTATIAPKAPQAVPETDWRELPRAAIAAIGDELAFAGEVVVALIRVPARHRMLRMEDLLRAADEAGVKAIPLVLLLGALIGLILAFQSLVPMRRFGADIYVANLVSLSLMRELGPLLTAMVLAGRSGSAFAAEIGTMKINQELDALNTMGVDTVTMLVLPRLLAVMFVMPVLTVLMDFAGLFGMTMVLTGFGIPPIVVSHQVAAAVVPLDFTGGLFKASLFGAAVAAIGCRSGLATGVGPRAVGQAATRAVVGGIVATVVLDGALAVLFNRLGW